jgi:hypothetical protein
VRRLEARRSLKAIIPGGSSAKVLKADEKYKLKDGRELTIWDIPMDFDTMAACGTMAGSGGVMIMDDSRSMAWVINNLNKFYAARVLRPVHPVPRRQPVDGEDQRPHRSRQCQPGRRGHAGAGRESDRRQDHLCLR